MEDHKSAILQMFYGEMGHISNLKFLPENDRLIGEVNTVYEELCEKLKTNPELMDLLTKYIGCLDALHVYETEHYYEEGFKCGLLIGIEAGESKKD